MLRKVLFFIILFYHTKMDDKKIIDFKEVDISKATGSIRSYLEMKKQYADCILMYRIGDFYETFFEDALLLSKICDVVLTKRKYSNIGNVALAGIPAGSFEIYLKKLLDNNVKVARAEQFKDENDRWIRKVTRVYSAATVYETELLEPDKNNYLASVMKNGKRYGFSYCDVSEGAIYISEGTKDEVFFELVKILPNELLLHSSDLLFEFRDTIRDFKNTRVCPEYFIAPEGDTSEGDFKNAKTCANAILNYLKDNQKDFMTKLDGFVKYSMGDYASLDFNTRRSLELTRMQADFKKKGSLLWFLDNTKTPMGKRLLKKWMNAPLYNVNEIIKRQTLIAQFCGNENLFKILEDFLEDFCDILRFCAKISNSTITCKELVQVAKVLKKAQNARVIFEECRGQAFGLDNDSLDILLDFSDIVERTFDFKCACEILPVKDGVNAHLDSLRADLRELCGNLDRLLKIQKECICDRTVLKDFPNLGYCFEIPSRFEGTLDGSCLVMQRLANSVRYTTAELSDTGGKIFSLRFQAAQTEKEIFKKLKEYSAELTFKIRAFARDVAILDVVYSISKCVREYDFCRVSFNTDKIFEIKQGIHPCVYKLRNNYVPNDTSFGTLVILTGANMSGKSTYLKQNAVIAILAQMCGFTCAKEANISPRDKIFFHGAIFDNLRENESAFMAEIKNLARITANSTSNSLVLLDEPVKSTNTADAGAFLLAFAHYFNEKIKAKTIISTHLLQSAKYADREGLFDVFKLDLNTRKIKKGTEECSSVYDSARAAGLDESIIKLAEKYASGQL